MRVEVYWNLHKHCYSVRALEGKDKGKVIEHTPHIALHNVKFVVQKAGREKVRREGRKNVHAFVRGELIKWDQNLADTLVKNGNTVIYNPYKFDQFMTNHDEHWSPIHDTLYAILNVTNKENPRPRIFID